MWCVHSACLIIIYVNFLAIIDNEKIEKNDVSYDNVYILHEEICYKDL
jgi:hypothetical protein